MQVKRAVRCAGGVRVRGVGGGGGRPSRQGWGGARGPHLEGIQRPTVVRAEHRVKEEGGALLQAGPQAVRCRHGQHLDPQVRLQVGRRGAARARQAHLGRRCCRSRGGCCAGACAGGAAAALCSPTRLGRRWQRIRSLLRHGLLSPGVGGIIVQGPHGSENGGERGVKHLHSRKWVGGKGMGKRRQLQDPKHAPRQRACALPRPQPAAPAGAPCPPRKYQWQP